MRTQLRLEIESKVLLQRDEMSFLCKNDSELIGVQTVHATLLSGIDLSGYFTKVFFYLSHICLSFSKIYPNSV